MDITTSTRGAMDLLSGVSTFIQTAGDKGKFRLILSLEKASEEESVNDDS
ncbi:hypothetical protein [Cohnella nanjingensis]|nr:hypothetical protein [Cohnella nanjingensis]